MSLELSWNRADDHCPRTSWRADRERFTTREWNRDGDLDRGILRLKDTDDRWDSAQTSFCAYQVDPDGEALKTVNFLLTAQNLIAKSLKPGADGEVTYTTGDRQPVAALRSAGLGIIRHGRAMTVAHRAASAAAKDQHIQLGPDAAREIVLFAEDVLRGYRIDIQEVSGREVGDWQSLCRRSGAYRFIGSGERIELADDEGYVKGALMASSRDPSADPDDHYFHEQY